MNPIITLRQDATDPVASRRDLAARPVTEKLRMLDALRERELAIRGRVRRRKEEVRMQKEEESRQK